MSGWVPPSSTGQVPWTPPAAPGPVVGWEAPPEPEGLGVRESLAEGWRLTRANLRPLVAISFVPEVLRNLALMPLWLAYGTIFANEIRFFLDLDFTRYRTDPEGLRRDLAAILTIPTDVAIAIAAGGTLSVIILVIGFGAISAGTLDAAAGRRPSVARAWSAVTPHLGTLLAPAIILGLAWAVIGVPVLLSQGASMSGSAGAQLLSSLLGLGSFVLAIVVVLVAVRWALVYQVVFSEDLGLVKALRRSAQLTHGARTRIGLALIALWFLIGIVISIVGYGIAFLAWLVTSSVEMGVIAFVVVLTITGFVYVPWLAATLTYIYRLRVGATSAVSGTAAAAPEAPAAVSPSA